MKSQVILSGLGAVLLAGSAFAQSAASTQLSQGDAQFVQMAGASGAAEVALGKLGSTQGKSGDVQSFGRQMVTDHTAANEKLMAIATKKGASVGSPSAEDSKAIERLGQMKSAEFDKAFATKMVADHQKAVALFEKESTQGKDSDLKAFATETLPTLKHHLEMAKKLPGKETMSNAAP